MTKNFTDKLKTSVGTLLTVSSLTEQKQSCSSKLTYIYGISAPIDAEQE